MDYIHLNSVRAGIVSGRRGESVLDYPWSSLAGATRCQRERGRVAGRGCGDGETGISRYGGGPEEDGGRTGPP